MPILPFRAVIINISVDLTVLRILGSFLRGYSSSTCAAMHDSHRRKRMAFRAKSTSFTQEHLYVLRFILATHRLMGPLIPVATILGELEERIIRLISKHFVDVALGQLFV